MEKLQGKVPQVRFPEFKDAWEQKTIGDIFDLNARPINKPLDNYKSIGIRSHFKGTFQRLDSDPSKNVMDTLFEVKENDLIVNITFAWEGAVAIASKDDEGGLVSHRFPTYINDKKKVNIDFFRFLFPTPEFKRTLTLISPGSAGRTRVLKKSDFLKIKFLFPTLPEQTRIASFFTVLDKKIAELKQKKNLLEQYKKDVTQKLFSQELRFKPALIEAEEDDKGKEFPKWEKKKLGKVTDINPKSEKLPVTFVYIDLESVVQGRLTKEDRINKLEAPSRAQRLLIKNDILFQMVRPYQKNNYFFDRDEKDFVASTGYAQIRTSGNSEFLFQFLHEETFVRKVIEKCTGTGYPAINSTDLSNIVISIPSEKEQIKIANFLSAIDDKINRTETQIQQTQEYKKGLLQKMFCE